MNWEILNKRGASSYTEVQNQATRRKKASAGTSGYQTMTILTEFTDPEPPTETEAVGEPSAEQQEAQRSLISQRLQQAHCFRVSFTLFDRRMQFYTDVYSGNGSVMRNNINNQGATIRNAGGPMVFGNVGESTLREQRGSRAKRLRNAGLSVNPGVSVASAVLVTSPVQTVQGPIVNSGSSFSGFPSTLTTFPTMG